MSLVTASGLSLAFGPKVLFQDASFTLAPRDRVGLVGPNGTGKSSLLRILAGESSPDTGTLAWRRGSRAGHLPQEVAALPDGPLVDVVLASVPGRASVEERLLSTEASLHAAREPEEQLELAQALADLHAELDHFDERFGRHRAERILEGLGFRTEALQVPTHTLSGGWKMRAALAGLLLQDPDLLLLDEPTNHLDIPTLTWFDAFLRSSTKALLLISHDREFLDRQIGRVLSLEPEGLRSYAGDYEDYRRLRAEEEERLTATARRQEARRAELQGFIDRFGAKATKARQAQSRQKMLDKMETVEVRAARATLSFRFAEAPRSGKEVLRLEGVSKSYGEKVVYRNLSASVQRGERIAIIGPNGAGKTTLLRLVAGELAADAGAVKLGLSVVPGYYAQHHLDRGAQKAPPFPPLAPGQPPPATPSLGILDRGAQKAPPFPPLAPGQPPPAAPSLGILDRGAQKAPPFPPLAPGQPPPAAPSLASPPEDVGRGFGALSSKTTILDALWDVVPEAGEGFVRGVAGGFMFSGEDVEKPLGVLSGGERARVALARILLQRSNLLLLDEPTNHLDLTSSEALIEALRGYDGTMLFVSHNRSFVNGLATRVWEVKDGAILDQPGNLDDWLYHQAQLAADLARGEAEPRGRPAAGRAASNEAGMTSEKERRRMAAEARNARRAREKPLRDAVVALERRIAELETAQRAAETALADPALYQDFARARPHVEALTAAKEELARLYPSWEDRQLELEALGTLDEERP